MVVKVSNIPNRVKNPSKEHPYVAGAVDIIDDAKGKSQDQVNKDVDDALTLHQSEINALDSENYESYTAEDGDTLADILPAEGAVDTIYRVGFWDGSANSGAGAVDATVYSRYAWDATNSEYKLLDVKTAVGEVFDISLYHASGGVLATYADLSAALAAIPQSAKRPGMRIQYVDSSDNKYVRFNYLLTDATTNSKFTNIANWQGVDTEPKEKSINLIESGAVDKGLALKTNLANRSVNYSEETISNLIVASTNKFQGGDNYRGCAINVKGYYGVFVKYTNNSASKFIAFFKDLDKFSTGVTPDYCDGYAARIAVDYNVKQFYRFPDDCNYLFVNISNSGDASLAPDVLLCGVDGSFQSLDIEDITDAGDIDEKRVLALKKTYRVGSSEVVEEVGNVEIPSADTTHAGLMSAQDKNDLESVNDAIPSFVKSGSHEVIWAGGAVAYNMIIGNDAKFVYNSSNNAGYLLDVSGYTGITIDYELSSTIKSIGFLKDDNHIVAGSSPDYCEGYTNRVALEDENVIMLPKDCNFIYFNIDNVSADFSLAPDVTLQGEREIISDINAEVTRLENDIREVELNNSNTINFGVDSYNRWSTNLKSVVYERKFNKVRFSYSEYPGIVSFLKSYPDSSVSVPFCANESGRHVFNQETTFDVPDDCKYIIATYTETRVPTATALTVLNRLDALETEVSEIEEQINDNSLEKRAGSEIIDNANYFRSQGPDYRNIMSNDVSSVIIPIKEKNYQYCIVRYTQGAGYVYFEKNESIPALNAQWTYSDGVTYRQEVNVTECLFKIPDDCNFLCCNISNSTPTNVPVIKLFGDLYNAVYDSWKLQEYRNDNSGVRGVWDYPSMIHTNRLHNSIFMSFTDIEGYTGLIKYDLTHKTLEKVNLKKSTTDDHNAGAVYELPNGKIVTVYPSGHGLNGDIWSVKNNLIEDIHGEWNFSKVNIGDHSSYCQIFEYSGTYFIFFRRNVLGWGVVSTTDFETFTDLGDLVTSQYQYYCKLQKIEGNSSRLRVAMYSNPEREDPAIRLGYVDLSTGNIYNADNTTLLGTFSNPPAQTDFTTIIDIPSSGYQRLYDVAVTDINNVKILYCRWTTNLDGEYFVYTNGNSVKIVDVGEAVLYPRYQGGITFITPTKVIVCRSDLALYTSATTPNNDYVEVWEESNGSWSKTVDVYSEPKGNLPIRQLRPCYVDGYISWCRGKYNVNNYTDFDLEIKLYDIANQEILL